MSSYIKPKPREVNSFFSIYKSNIDSLKNKNYYQYGFKVVNEFHSYVNNIKRQAKSKLDNFHHSYLKEKCSNYLSINSNSNIFLTRSSIDKNYPVSLTSFNECNKPKKNIKNYKQLSIKTQPPNPLISQKLYHKNFNFDERPGNVKKFVENTKLFHKMNILSNCQSERYKQFQEEMNKKNTEIQIKTYSCKENLNLLGKTIHNLNLYVKHINSQVEVEKQKLNSILAFQNELEISNKILQQKILKAENKISLYNDYKIFLLKVKYKVQDINQIPKDELHKYGFNLPNEENRTLGSRRSSVIKRQSIARKSVLYNKRPSKLGNFLEVIQGSISSHKHQIENHNHVNTENKNEVANYNIPIFDSINEFKETISNLERNTFDLFHNLGETSEKLHYMTKEKETEFLHFNEIQQNNYNYLTSLENLLSEAKEKYDYLLKKKKALINPSKEECYSKISNTLSRMILKFPINLEQELNEQYIYQNISSELNTVLVNGTKTNKILYAISLIEKLLLHYSIKLKKFKSNPKNMTTYRECRTIVDKKIKEEKNKKNKEKESQKQGMLIDKVIRKNNKIYFKQRRQVHFSPIFLNKRKNRNINRENITKFNEYESMLTY